MVIIKAERATATCATKPATVKRRQVAATAVWSSSLLTVTFADMGARLPDYKACTCNLSGTDRQQYTPLPDCDCDSMHSVLPVCDKDSSNCTYKRKSSGHTCHQFKSGYHLFNVALRLTSQPQLVTEAGDNSWSPS